MKSLAKLVFLTLIGVLGLHVGSAKACDFDLVNNTSSPFGHIRLYNSHDRYLGFGEEGPVGAGDKFRFSERRMEYGDAAWPDSCSATVYVDFNVGLAGTEMTDGLGARHCHLKKQIARAPDATLDVDNRYVVSVGERDLIKPGACQDR